MPPTCRLPPAEADDDPPIAPPYGPRIYGRIRAAELSCPGCGRLHKVRTVVGGHRSPFWDPDVGVLSCSCGLKWYLGIVCWNVGQSRRVRPADQVPTAGEAMQLRMVGSYYAAGRLGPRGTSAHKYGAHRVVNVQCLCHVRCPVHRPASEVDPPPEKATE